jgi:integrase
MAKPGHTSNGQGTLLLERKIAGVQIRRASGTKNPDELARIISLLEALGTTGRPDLVAKVANGEIRALSLLRLSFAGQPFPAPSPASLTMGEATRHDRRALLLDKAVSDMLARKKGQASHLNEMRRQLLALAARHPRKTVADLLGVLIAEREAYALAGHRAAFTRLRANSLVLAAWADGGTHGATWREIRDGIGTMKVRPRERRGHHPFKVSEMEMLRRLLNDEKAGAGESLVALCITGMRPSEYWSKNWSVGGGMVGIMGTKNLNAKRQIPQVAQIAPAYKSFAWWGKLFRKVLRDQVTKSKPGELLPWTAYDCRRTFAQWLDASGVPRWRAAYYLGHSPSTMTDFYASAIPTDTEIWEDGARLRAFIPASLAAEEAAIEAEGSVIRTHKAAQRPLILEFGKKL